jgi:hypothetical protein
MPTVYRKIELIQIFDTEITQEQYDLYEQSPDEFIDLYYSELSDNEDLFDEKVLNEWIEVEE